MPQNHSRIAVEEVQRVRAGGQIAERDAGDGVIAQNVPSPILILRFVQFDGRLVVERDGVRQMVVGVDGERGQQMHLQDSVAACGRSERH